MVPNGGQVPSQEAQGQKGWQEKEKEVILHIDNYKICITSCPTEHNFNKDFLTYNKMYKT
jgi:hypothetical protein